MKKGIYLDCYSGICGNMFVGALLDIGVPLAYLKEEISKIPIKDYEFLVEKVRKVGVHATSFEVILTKEQPERYLADIFEIIENSSLDVDIQEKIKAVFTKLAIAKAKIHETDIESVRFHKMGGIDCIIDIAAVILGISYLEVEEIQCSALNIGMGKVPSAHEEVDVLAAVTTELLCDVPTYHKNVNAELVTPTGAALITVLSTGFDKRPEHFVVDRVAYGAGTYDLAYSNTVGIYLGYYMSEKESVLGRKIDVFGVNPKFH